MIVGNTAVLSFKVLGEGGALFVQFLLCGGAVGLEQSGQDLLVLHPQNGGKVVAALRWILVFPLATGAWNCLMTFSTSALPQPGLCPAGQHFIHNCEMPPLCLLQTISEAKHGSLPLLTVGKSFSNL